jgi:hypothetical protein
MDLTSFSEYKPKGDILTEWRWLIGEDKKVVYIFKSGDAILSDSEDAVYRLDAGAGVLVNVADNLEEFDKKMDDKDFYNSTTLAPLISRLEQEKPLKEDQVYSYIKLPLFGGEYNTENMYPLSVEEHFGITGDICFQAKDLKDGDQVEINVTE